MRLLRLLILFSWVLGGVCSAFGNSPAVLGVRAAINGARKAALQVSGSQMSLLKSVPFFEVPVGESVEPLLTMFSSDVSLENEPFQPYLLLSNHETDAFVFDLDGTLLDSLDAWDNAASNYLKTRGIEMPPDLQTKVEQMSLIDGAQVLKERYHLEETPEELLAATIRPVGERYYNDIPAKTEVPTLLAFLHAQGIKMAVATASHADFARGALERLGLLDYFEFIITCDEVGVGKTNSLVYEEAMKRLGASKERTVVVEDAPYALKTAHLAGFKTIGVAEEHYQNETTQMQQMADLFLDFDK